MNVPQFRNVSTCRNCGDIFRIHPLIHHSREHENREEKSTRVPGWLRTLETPIRNVEIEILVFTKSNLSTRLRDKFWIDLSKFWSNLSGARHYVLCAHVAWFFLAGWTWKNMENFVEARGYSIMVREHHDLTKNIAEMKLDTFITSNQFISNLCSDAQMLRKVKPYTMLFFSFHFSIVFLANLW